MAEDLDARMPAALDYAPRDRRVRNLERLKIALRIDDSLEPRGPEEAADVAALHHLRTAWIARLERELEDV